MDPSGCFIEVLTFIYLENQHLIDHMWAYTSTNRGLYGPESQGRIASFIVRG